MISLRQFLLIIVLIFNLTFLPVIFAFNNNSLSIWDVLRGQLILDHKINNTDVKKHIKLMLKNPKYFMSLKKAEPYIYHIIKEIQLRNLPGELALLPMIESTFNPFAYSNKGAAGLWQFMPNTGNEMGLKQTWLQDDRRNIDQSTKAALNYLNYLSDLFDKNWYLAFAAYNAGPGNINRALQKHHLIAKDPNCFWQLPTIPQQTKDYVPKLLALAEIIKYSEFYHIKLPHIPYTPYFQEVRVNNSMDLMKAANLAGISYQELIKLNPSYNRFIINNKNQPMKLFIPQTKVRNFYYNLNFAPRMINKLPKKNIKYKLIHIVQIHESYASIASKYQVTPQNIRSWNNISLHSPLRVNQSLVIWKNLNQKRHYRVTHGENIYAIAKKFDIPITKLIKLNPGIDLKNIIQGQDLIIG